MKGTRLNSNSGRLTFGSKSFSFKNKAESANKDKNAKEGSGKKESFSLDTTESTKQKLIKQEYKYKTDFA